MATTRYEIRATKGDKSKFVAFTVRRTLEMLRHNTFLNADEIVAAIGADAVGTIVSQSVDGGIVFSDGAKVAFTGYTELDRINEARRAAQATGVDPDAEAVAIAAQF